MFPKNLHSYIRRNELGIQMIPTYLRNQIFGNLILKSSKISKSKLEESKYHLYKHSLWKKQISNYEKQFNVSQDIDEPKYPIPDIVPPIFNLPPLNGNNIEEHFFNIGEEYSRDYKKIVENIINMKIPEIPKKWVFNPGWTKYSLNSENEYIGNSVDYPSENFFIFDTEVCMNDGDGHYPTLAVALSEKHWYSWCSNRLVVKNFLNDLIHKKQSDEKHINISELISIGYDSKNARLIVGHNVGYDRSFIKEQYYLKNDKLKFLDTLSMHISLSGLTGYQKALFFSYKVAQEKGASNDDIVNKFISNGHPDPSSWKNTGSLNSLKDIYKFYCGKNLNKEQRDIFVKGNLEDVKKDFQSLTTYCATDVLATFEVFKFMWKKFLNHFPHPISLAGTLEMSTTYLPVNLNNWNRYLNETQSVYNDLQKELKLYLKQIANDACKLKKNETYKKDLWLWDLNWNCQDVRLKKNSNNSNLNEKNKNLKLDDQYQIELNLSQNLLYSQTDLSINAEFKNSFMKQLKNSVNLLKKNQPLMPGYPQWYRDLCEQPLNNHKIKDALNLNIWEPGPYLISTQLRIIPKLLNLTWKGFVLHYSSKDGWGYLVPNNLEYNQDYIDKFPYKEYINFIKKNLNTSNSCDQNILFDNIKNLKKNKSKLSKNCKNKLTKEQDEIYSVQMFGCTFYRLPHKDGIKFKVGNPLSKSFLTYLDDGSLKANLNEIAKVALKLSTSLSYWKMTNKRISSQLVCQIDDEKNSFGALLPRVIVAGTITRRAVEQTWLTASNAYEDRAGSELKAMIQAPHGYKFVGADVDSQELWIASLLGDSNFIKLHGCTALGWMTLQGTKSNCTDMHSKIALLVNINRNQAKVLNYGRIYGAGKAFATRFLKQSNPDLSEHEAKNKAEMIYKQTKGHKKNVNSNFSNFILPKEGVTAENINECKTNFKKWVGGSESHMFNKLEEIAKQQEPRTPVLNCGISCSLISEQVKKDFLPSIINWVVQSSAVDYLHLMLVSMHHLKQYFQLDGRFCLSIHDEVRYLFKQEDEHKAAFALQITNLLTRAMFCSKLKIYDLPMSVAFFDSIDLDFVFRKEVDMDCKTLSNPHGLKIGYNIDFGQKVTMHQLMQVEQVKRISEFRIQNQSHQNANFDDYKLKQKI